MDDELDAFGSRDADFEIHGYQVSLISWHV